MNGSRSNVVLLDDGSRSGYLPAILPITMNFNNQRVFLPAEVVYWVVAAFAGFREINRKSGKILPFIPQRLADCDFDISVEFRDSTMRPVVGAQQLLDPLGLVVHKRNTRHSRVTTSNATNKTQSNDTSILNGYPFAALGAIRSSTTQLLTTLGHPFELPIMSFASTSQDLDYNPLFARTVPTNAGDATAIALYLQHLQVTHVGIVYVADLWGNSFHLALQNELNQKGIVSLSSPYFDYRTASDAEASIQRLAKAEYKYIIALTNIDTSPQVFYLAYQNGIMGHPGYSWIFPEAIVLSDLTFRRDDSFESDVARALHGAARIELQTPTHEKFEQYLLDDFASSESLQMEFKKLVHDPGIFSSEYNFTKEIQLLAYHYFAFDAAIALGIAACETPGQFTGAQFYETLLQTRFEGVSGSVSFEESGTRSLQGLQFQVRNFLISDELSTSTHFVLSADVVAEISVGNASLVNFLKDFIYPDNGTIPPSALPPLNEDLNLISTTSLIVGLIIGGSVMVTSATCIIWTFFHRNHRVVSSSQPFFLYLLCIGTTIMALSVIPLSFQEPTSLYWLDVACMSVPWFLLIGFVTAFSAILCKTTRLNKLLKSAQSFRRIAIHPKDVIIPFLVLISINTALLLAWSFVDPIHWYRAEVTNYDSFGRITESYGVCRLGSSHVYLAFAIPLGIVDISAILLALRQCYKARNTAVEFSESRYLFLSMASLLEALILAVPMSHASSKHPSVAFVVSSIIVALLCFTILVPIFVPKYMMVKGHNLAGSINSRRSSRGIYNSDENFPQQKQQPQPVVVESCPVTWNHKQRAITFDPGTSHSKSSADKT